MNVCKNWDECDSFWRVCGLDSVITVDRIVRDEDFDKIMNQTSNPFFHEDGVLESELFDDKKVASKASNDKSKKKKFDDDVI